MISHLRLTIAGIALLMSGCGSAPGNGNAEAERNPAPVSAAKVVECDDCRPRRLASAEESLLPVYRQCGLKAEDSFETRDAGFVAHLPRDPARAEAAAACLSRARAPGLVPMLLLYADDQSLRGKVELSTRFRLIALRAMTGGLAGEVADPVSAQAVHVARRILDDRRKYRLKLADPEVAMLTSIVGQEDGRPS